jgi:hypothetical protein
MCDLNLTLLGNRLTTLHSRSGQIASSSEPKQEPGARPLVYAPGRPSGSLAVARKTFKKRWVTPDNSLSEINPKISLKYNYQI